jgi:hypothetical protein
MRDRSYLPPALTDVSRLEYVALVALFVCEALVFYSQLAEQFVPFYPANFDQAGYMLRTYQLIDAFHREGWTALLKEIIRPNSATGVSFAVQGAVLSILGGANRTAMLSLNLLYLVTLQTTLYCTVRTLTRNVGLSWIALAYLLSLGTIFYFAGGLYDYRIDFSALCLYGIWTCLVLTSAGFRHVKGALLVGAVGALLVSLRFFTLLYVGAVIAGLFVLALVGAWWSASSARRRVAATRARHLFICGTVTLVIAGPILFGARKLIYDYYGIGHFIGEEKYVRAAEQGVYTTAEHLLYYPTSILFTHLGSLTLKLAGVVMLLALMASIFAKQASAKRVLLRVRRYRFEFVALAFAIVAPIMFLTADFSKSPVVGGIVVVPIILLVVLFCSSMWPRRLSPTFEDARSRAFSGQASPGGLMTGAIARWIDWSAPIVPAVVMAVALAGFLSHATANQRRLSRTDLERITLVNDTIARYVYEGGKPEMKFSTDRVVDYLHLGTIQLSGYERLRRWLPLSPRFGHGPYGIFSTPRETALKLVMDSDIVVLTDPVRDRSHPYPMNTTIREYWDELWAWVDQNRILLMSTDIVGVPYRVFARPLIRLEGQSADDWILSSGMSIKVDASHLFRWPFIVLEGDAIYELLGNEPRPRAIVLDPSGRGRQELPAKLRKGERSYQVVIDARGLGSSTSEPKTIHLTFDRYFVPKALGISADPRELVVRFPSKRELRGGDKLD